MCDGSDGPPEIEALAFSRDGRRLVSAMAEEIVVWALDEAAAQDVPK